jgi:hypothetical protein
MPRRMSDVDEDTKQIYSKCNSKAAGNRLVFFEFAEWSGYPPFSSVPPTSDCGHLPMQLFAAAAGRGCIEIGIAASELLKAGAGCIESFNDPAFQIGEESRSGILRAGFGPIV